MSINIEKFVEINAGVGAGSETDPIFPPPPPIDPNCPLVTVDPGPPYNFDENCYPNGPTFYNNTPIDGCNLITFHGESCIAATTMAWQVRDVSGNTDPAARFNFYLFTGGGALIDSQIEVPMPILSTDIVFTQSNVLATAMFTFVISGFNELDMSSINTQVVVSRTP